MPTEETRKRWREWADYNSPSSQGEPILKRSLKVTVTRIRRQDEITIQGVAFSAHCPACGREVVSVSKAQAMELMAVNEMRFDALAVTGQIHVTESDNGNVRICRNSLLVR